ncbi:MAG: protein phosphatase 2C domain-containing protein [Halioglobus sp.]
MSIVQLAPGISSAGQTDVARRKHNEDAFLINESIGLLLVADGVGGHHAGEIASGITCESIERDLGAGLGLEEAIRNANHDVMAALEAGKGKPGMASTVVAMRMQGAEYRIDWVGDSRAYLWDGSLHLLTRDHSFVAAQLELGRITIEEARNHPRKNVIVQAVGLQNEDNLDIGAIAGRINAGEMLLLCSDGLNDVLENQQIIDILRSGETLTDRCQALIQSTLDAGGRDNVTVVLVEADESVRGSVQQRPEPVWSFDPATGKYSGLPELDRAPAQSAGVRRVAPKGAGATQMIPVAQVEAMRKLAVKEAKRKSRSRIFWIGLTTVTVIAAAYLAWLIVTGR